MSTEETVRDRVSEFPRDIPQVIIGFAVTVALAVRVRFASGAVLVDPIRPVTFLSLLGGGFGATAMYAFVRRYDSGTAFAPISFWANVLGDGASGTYRQQGIYLHITYGSLAGAFFPRITDELYK